MAEWLVEEGIGEHRAVQLAGDRIVAATTWWPHELASGWVIDAKLIHRTSGSARGTALSETGEEVVVTALPREAREGAAIRLEITRSAIASAGRLKRAQARPSTSPRAAPTLAEQMRQRGENVTLVRRFPGGDWDELIAEAIDGSVDFPGGSLLFAPTPAMLTVDIDGDLPPRALALAAVAPLSAALRRFDVGGSVAIDFPTLQSRDDRRAVDTALADALVDWPHERTAINGFGLVQIVARLQRPSLFQRAAWQRKGLVWRQLLRRAEALDGAGHIELTISPLLSSQVEAGQIAELERRSGKHVEVATVATQVLEAPHAQLIDNG